MEAFCTQQRRLYELIEGINDMILQLFPNSSTPIDSLTWRSVGERRHIVQILEKVELLQESVYELVQKRSLLRKYPSSLIAARSTHLELLQNLHRSMQVQKRLFKDLISIRKQINFRLFTRIMEKILPLPLKDQASALHAEFHKNQYHATQLFSQLLCLEESQNGKKSLKFFAQEIGVVFSGLRNMRNDLTKITEQEEKIWNMMNITSSAELLKMGYRGLRFCTEYQAKWLIFIEEVLFLSTKSQAEENQNSSHCTYAKYQQLYYEQLRSFMVQILSLRLEMAVAIKKDHNLKIEESIQYFNNENFVVNGHKIDDLKQIRDEADYELSLAIKKAGTLPFPQRFSTSCDYYTFLLRAHKSHRFIQKKLIELLSLALYKKDK